MFRRGVKNLQNLVLAVVMFTPQRAWSGWSLTPNKSGPRGGTGSGSDLGPNSGDGASAKGKGVTVVENGGNLDREVLLERVSSLKKEVSLLNGLCFDCFAALSDSLSFLFGVVVWVWIGFLLLLLSLKCW